MPKPRLDADPHGLLDQLQSLGRPTYRAYVTKRYSPEARARARSGFFVIQGVEVEIRTPVNWHPDLGSRSREHWLHAFTWMDTLLQAYESERDLEALDQALALSLDWIAHHGSATDRESFAWYDQAVGIRAPYLAFVLRASAWEGRLKPADCEVILASLQEHGTYLCSPSNYAGNSNHGLFQDEGLVLLAAYLPFLDEAQGWATLGSERAVGTLGVLIDWGEALSLEHSPSYHQYCIHTVTRLAQAGVAPERLLPLRARLVESAGWLVLPDESLPEIGDTDHRRAAAASIESSRDKHGAKVFWSGGIAAIRERGTALYISAGYHGHSHKHADELGFVLFAEGRRVIGDTGRWGYYAKEPERQYAVSSFAHNTLMVDGQAFDWRGTTPYGSGLRGAGEGSDWYGIEAANPLLAAAGVEHRRLFLLKPDVCLLVIDHVESADSHLYTRLLHFAPEVEAEEKHDTLALSAEGFSGAVGAYGPEPATVRLARGREEPSLRGWTYPEDRRAVPVWTAEFETRASSTEMALAINLRDAQATVTSIESTERDSNIELDLSGEHRMIQVVRDGRRLDIVDKIRR